jgi:Mce-associated membrane protein
MTSGEPAREADAERLAREADPERLAREAEAEAEAARARAEAAAARAAELRRQVEAVAEVNSQPEPEADPAPRPVVENTARPESASVRRGLAAAVTAVVVTALVSATALMLWAHRDAAAQSRQVAEFAAAARQSVVNLMAIDYTTADDSVARVLDGSTGKFRDNFAETSDDFVKALQEERIITTATVNDAAVESISGDSAVVLVSATSRREGPKAPKDQQQPRVWRVVLNLQRDGGQIKMSGVEFV